MLIARVVIASIFLVLSVSLVGSSPFLQENALRPSATLSISLYGSASQGWGFSWNTLTSPGPTITVNQFDAVNLRLEGVDSPRHNFYVDYDGDASPDATEPVSPDFRNGTGPVTFPFTASTAGTFTYYCEYHQGIMRGTFVVRTVGAAPAATVSIPDGVQDWTGSTVHRIWWNMSDADDANTVLAVYLNYSSSGGSGTIVGPRAGTANPNFVDWTVPAIDAGDVVVNLTVIDPGGLKGWAKARVPVVDSTAPRLVTTLPDADATNVPRTATIQVTWSEAMDAGATGAPASFGLRIAPAGPWVTGTFSWNSPQNTVMTFTPSTQLQPSTTYEAIANTTATDDSDPGNALASAYSWTFTTGTAADTQPPQISAVAATPAVQEVGGAVNVSAVVTDNFGVASVWLNVTAPSGTATNATMVRGTGAEYYLNRTYAKTGVHAFRIWAVDTSGLATSASDQFEIGDTEPPTIVHTPPSSLGLGEPLTITATVTDPGGVADVRLAYTDTAGQAENVTMTAAGSTYTYEIPMQLRTGTLTYFIWAVDDTGNGGKSATASVPVQAPANTIILYGDTVRGWGFGPDNITSPGPTIRVREGVTVNLLLIPADGILHNFYVDTDADGVADADEPQSADFEDRALAFSFVASRAGTFTYYCEYHPSMHGTFVVEGQALLGQDLTLLWIAAGISIAVVAAAAVLALLHRRGKSPPPMPPST